LNKTSCSGLARTSIKDYGFCTLLRSIINIYKL